MFAGWAEVEEPRSSSKALALHRINVLRELRGALHGAAVVSCGVDPHAAVMLRTPQMAAVFGWSEPHPDFEPQRADWDRAQSATNSSMALRLSVLSGTELSEFVELAEAAHATRV